MKKESGGYLHANSAIVDTHSKARGTSGENAFVMRRLGEKDVPSLLGLRAEVLSRLEHPDIYVPERDQMAFVTNHVAGTGHTFGVFSAGCLVAYGMLGLPAADDDDNLGRVLGLDAEQCGRVAHLASCMILPEYRGHCLQRDLIAVRVGLAKELGRRHCLAMVSLRNEVSRNHLFAAGFAIRWVGELGELRRQLLYRDLKCPAEFDAAQKTLVAPLDFERQCELTRRDWWGTGDIGEKTAVSLAFMPRLPSDVVR